MQKIEKGSQVLDLQLLILLSGSIAVVTGSLTLLGWITGVPHLVSVFSGYVPMAVSTSIFFILYGIVLVFGFNGKSGTAFKVILLILTAICSMYGFLQFAGNLAGVDLNFDSRLFPGGTKIGNFTSGHMSPYSGALFFLCGIAIYLKLLAGYKVQHRNIIGGIGLLVAFAGFLALLGYLYGSPFLYSGNLIPLSLRAAICFFSIGSGLLFAGGGVTVFLRQLVGPNAEAKLLRVLLPSTIGIFLLEGGLHAIFINNYKISEALLLAFLTISSVILFIVIVTNVTREIFRSSNIAEAERLKAVEELRRANALQTHILENTTMGICMIQNHTIKWTNSRFTEIFHLDTSVQGVPAADIFRSDKLTEIYSEWFNLLREGKLIDKSIQLEHRDGEKFWCRFIGSSFSLADPDEGSIWMVEDITERKRSRERMHLLSHTIECLSECISITDIQDRILFVNEAFRKTYGYTDDELINKNISVISSVRNDPELIKTILPATLNGGWQGEIINKKKNGTEFPVNISTSPVIDENGSVVALVGVASDITERRQAGEQLRKFAGKLKESNDAKDKLFNIIAHDLRSPFNLILGYSKMLAEDFDNLSEMKKRSFVREIKESSEHTFELLDNLLTWSRTQTGGIKIICSKVDLADIAIQQVMILNATAYAKKVDLTSNIVPGTYVFGDKDMVKTILINLIGNAIKFTREGGRVTLSSSIRERDVLVSVEDTGVGISASAKENLFKLDKSASTPGTSNEKGTGLGLIICKEFTELNNGIIWVESEPGKGSRFVFSLPLYLD